MCGWGTASWAKSTDLKDCGEYGSGREHDGFARNRQFQGLIEDGTEETLTSGDVTGQVAEITVARRVETRLHDEEEVEHGTLPHQPVGDRLGRRFCQIGQLGLAKW